MAPFRFIGLDAAGVFLCVLGLSAVTAYASPPACQRSDAGMFMAADAVVNAVVTKSRRWAEGADAHHLVAKYRVVAEFKGPIAAGATVIVTATCFDRPVPMGRFGPTSNPNNYCAGGAFRLPGVDTRSGRSIPRSGKDAGWVLFLRANHRPGAPELTWLEVSRTGHGSCGGNRDDLSPAERASYDRARKHLKDQPTR